VHTVSWKEMGLRRPESVRVQIPVFARKNRVNPQKELGMVVLTARITACRNAARTKYGED
jgi:hypothetical protein